MKKYRQYVAIALLGLFLMAMDGLGQSNAVITPDTREPIAEVVVSDQIAPADSVNLSSTLQRPVRPERYRLSPEVLERIAKFRREAQRYIEQQEILKRQLLGATDQDRARIREQLHTVRQQWLERARELRQEFKDRQQELMETLPGHREVLEGARQTARDQLRDQIQETRNDVRVRRGED